MAIDRCQLIGLREELGIVFITIDTGETFELAPGSVPPELPPIGGSISSSLLAEIILAAERKKVARRIFSMLDKRLLPLAKMRKKLIEEGYDRDAIEPVFEKLGEQDLYSDRKYAEAWCRTCLITKTVGRRYMVSKLLGKQIPKTIAVAAADQVLDTDRETELAYQAAEKRWRRIHQPIDRKIEAKVVRFLIGRGFSAQLAGRAMRATRPDDRSDCTNGELF